MDKIKTQLRTQVTGTTMVFRHDREGRASYTIKLGHKNISGEFDNAWLYCKFRKGVEIDDRSIIDIKKGWLEFYPVKFTVIGRDGKPTEKAYEKFGVFISEFDVVGTNEPVYNEPADSFAMANEDIPF